MEQKCRLVGKHLPNTWEAQSIELQKQADKQNKTKPTTYTTSKEGMVI